MEIYGSISKFIVENIESFKDLKELNYLNSPSEVELFADALLKFHNLEVLEFSGYDRELDLQQVDKVMSSLKYLKQHHKFRKWL